MHTKDCLQPTIGRAILKIFRYRSSLYIFFAKLGAYTVLSREIGMLPKDYFSNPANFIEKIVLQIARQGKTKGIVCVSSPL